VTLLDFTLRFRSITLPHNARPKHYVAAQFRRFAVPYDTFPLRHLAGQGIAITPQYRTAPYRYLTLLNSAIAVTTAHTALPPRRFTPQHRAPPELCVTLIVKVGQVAQESHFSGAALSPPHLALRCRHFTLLDSTLPNSTRTAPYFSSTLHYVSVASHIMALRHSTITLLHSARRCHHATSPLGTRHYLSPTLLYCVLHYHHRALRDKA